MKVRFECYNPNWAIDFAATKAEMLESIGFLGPNIEHIGSTSVEGLSAKPIIDILVGIAHEGDLERVIIPLVDKGYVYFQKYNSLMPYRRFFVKYKVDPKNLSVPGVIREQDAIPTSTEEHSQRFAHVHVLPHDSEHWIRHIAFRDYLRAHPQVKEQYQRLKEQLSTQEWTDSNDYNDAKDKFIKSEERKAIDWYRKLYL